MEHTEHLEHTETPKDMKSQIWKTFWILFAFTIIDIVLYFMLLSNHSMIKNWVFIILGVVKAYYIGHLLQYLAQKPKVFFQYLSFL